MTSLTTADLYAEWLTEIKAAATELRRCVKASKHNQEQCCEVLNRALEAVMSLEHTIGIGHLRSQQRQSIVAAIISNIEFAQLVVKVISQCSCCTLATLHLASNILLSRRSTADTGTCQAVPAYLAAILLKTSSAQSATICTALGKEPESCTEPALMSQFLPPGGSLCPDRQQLGACNCICCLCLKPAVLYIMFKLRNLQPCYL